ncbi:MAG TPA: alpha/beta hydrolase [Jatrophihabitans sp.]|jgi:pimeloyl-ACP methyl ester carboxylesterase|uniref:alpha/beta fold hydrolase n=1 Tax=Jatrophihabitans sp. TaxID=1932789 RepID=UPI002F228001
MPFMPDSSSSAAGPAGKPPTGRRGHAAVGALVAASALLVGTAAGAAAHGASRAPVPSQAAFAKASQGKVIKGQTPFDLAGYKRTFREGMVPVEGASVHYIKGGAGPALVLVHGWSQTSWAWHKVMPELAKTHTVIALDLPGLGSSTIPKDGFDAAHTARRLHEAVLALGYQRVQILAHDIGALVAYPYAKQFPNDVSRMAVLEAPLNGFGLESFYGLSFHFGLNSAPKPIPENIIDNGDVSTYLGMLFNGTRHPETIDQQVYFRAYHTQARRSAGYEYYRAFPQNAQYNQANASAKVSLPVLAMGAQYVFGPAMAASFRAVASDVREVIAPDSGHYIPEENPAFLLACAGYFFGDTSATPPAELASCKA